MKIATLLAASALSFTLGQAQAAVVVTLGGPALPTADRQATFDGLTDFNSADLSTYVEDGIAVQTPTSYPNFAWCGALNACWYANGGYSIFNTRESNLARIRLGNGADMTGVEFTANPIWLLGLGFLESTLVWETYNDGALVAQGSLLFTELDSLLTWRDDAGFDELRVGSFDLQGRPLFGGDTSNLITIDNLRVAAAHVPEPASVGLLAIGLAALAGSARRKASKSAGALAF